MIAPLRRSHFYIWIGLAITLSALFVGGLVARRTATPPNAGFSWERYR